MTELILRSDSLTDRVAVSIERLQAHEPAEGYWLAFSGGKDSQCIYRLAELAGIKFDAHFSLTTVDPPEVIAFVREHYPQVQMQRPEQTMWQLIVQEGVPPTRKVRYCCRKLKEVGGRDRLVVTGIRRAESTNRKQRRLMENCRLGHNRVLLHPIIDWSDANVWDFLTREGLPHCSLYEEGRKRIGCILCPVANTRQRFADAERWPKFVAAYKLAFRRMLDARRRDGLRCDWQSEEEAWDWWMDDSPREVAEESLSLFGDE